MDTLESLWTHWKVSGHPGKLQILWKKKYGHSEKLTEHIIFLGIFWKLSYYSGSSQLKEVHFTNPTWLKERETRMVVFIYEY